MKAQLALLLALMAPFPALSIGYVYTGVGDDGRQHLELTSVDRCCANRRAHRPHAHRPDLHQPRRMGGGRHLRIHSARRGDHHRPSAVDRRQADTGGGPRKGRGAPHVRRHCAPAHRPSPDRAGDPQPISPEHLPLSGPGQPPRRIRVHAAPRIPQRPPQLLLPAGPRDRPTPANGAVRAAGTGAQPARL